MLDGAKGEHHGKGTLATAVGTVWGSEGTGTRHLTLNAVVSVARCTNWADNFDAFRSPVDVQMRGGDVLEVAACRDGVSAAILCALNRLRFDDVPGAIGATFQQHSSAWWIGARRGSYSPPPTISRSLLLARTHEHLAPTGPVLGVVPDAC